MTDDGTSFSERQKIVFGLWLFIKFAIVLGAWTRVARYIITQTSQHVIENELHLNLGEIIFLAIVFIVFSDIYNFETVRRLKIPGSAMKRLITLSFLDLVTFPLAILAEVIYNNLQAVEKVPALELSGWFVLLLIVKNWIFSYFMRRGNAVSN
jgi:hypothetical protein